MSNKKNYVKGLEELIPSAAHQKAVTNEFQESLPFEDTTGIMDAATPRRDFLKYLGFSTAAATLAASCKIPVRKAMTWAVKPNDITPGVALYYASAYVDGGEVVPVVVKTREARPIKIEGNTLSKATEGGTSAKVQGSVISLYDVARLKQPMLNGKPESTWEAIDNAVVAGLTAAAGAPIYLLTSTQNSATVADSIAKFTAKYSNVKHVQYDAISYSGLLDACAKATGKRAIPTFQFDKAQTILSIGADFLGTWLSPVMFAKGYSKGRKVTKANPKSSKHYQIEGTMTITGGAADERATCKPSEYGKVAVALLGAINGAKPAFKSAHLNTIITKAAADLKSGNGLVVCGSNDTNVQEVVLAINAAIGAFGNTVNTATSDNSKKGNDSDMEAVVAGLKAGTVGGIMVYDCNPVYDHYAGDVFAKAIPTLKLSVSFNERNCETTQKCKVVAPASHWLESWGDFEYKTGHIALQQPTIAPLFKTRPFAENMLKWGGDITEYNQYFVNYYQGKLGGVSGLDKAIQDGVIEPETAAIGGSYTGNAAEAIAKISAAPDTKGLELVVYEKVAIGRGAAFSNNPWLQEMPDPVTKCTWDNYVAVSPNRAKSKEFNAELTDLNEVERPKKVFKITANGKSKELPVVVVPGMHDDVMAVAVGYGRDKAVGRVAQSDASNETQNGGANAYPFTAFNATSGSISFANIATAERTSKMYPLAITQTHHSYEQRTSVVKEFTLDEFVKNPDAFRNERLGALHHYTTDYDNLDETHGDAHGGGHGEAAAHGAAAATVAHAGAEAHGAEGHSDKVSIAGEEHDVEKLYRKNGTLYPTYDSPGLKWGLSIDLSSCNGCGACTIACQVENNVSVVGKEQVMKVHDMHWLRIDRYFASTTSATDLNDSDSIQTVFMPMMCQHCDNAPCENVCPVNASNHSSEGVNQMAYNRCIGTRYCANNCPFKVRRFNWRDWNGADSFKDNAFEDGFRDDINSDLTRMVLNPDVTVRSRGVIEKCSFCAQRTQAAKTKAKTENRVLVDADINSACAQACPTNALVFGNVNDKESNIYKTRNVEGKERVFYALEELHVLPNVNYMAKVRNTSVAGAPKEAKPAHAGAHATEAHS
jgi:MoCo/4Fe-4S cofactor protein with predicted Tat translocation signal